MTTPRAERRSVRRFTCKWCGACILVDDERNTLHHEELPDGAPCEAFEAQLRALGLYEGRTKKLIKLDDASAPDGTTLSALIVGQGTGGRA